MNMSNSFSFLGPEEFDQHHCEGVREGEWLVFKCRDCTYERRYNSITGEMKVIHGPGDVLHDGRYNPPALNMGGIHPN